MIPTADKLIKLVCSVPLHRWRPVYNDNDLYVLVTESSNIAVYINTETGELLLGDYFSKIKVPLDTRESRNIIINLSTRIITRRYNELLNEVFPALEKQNEEK